MGIKVLLILEAAGGGTGRHVLDLSLGLRRRGIEVHLAYSPLRMDPLFAQGLPLLREAGVRLLPLPMRRGPHPGDALALARLYAYARVHGPFPIVHGHSAKGGALARLLAPLLRAKAVYTPHGLLALRGPSPYNLAERALAPSRTWQKRRIQRHLLVLWKRPCSPILNRLLGIRNGHRKEWWRKP